MTIMLMNVTMTIPQMIITKMAMSAMITMIKKEKQNGHPNDDDKILLQIMMVMIDLGIF